MLVLAGIIFWSLLGVIVVGLIRPELVVRWTDSPTRAQVLVAWGGVFLALMALLGGVGLIADDSESGLVRSAEAVRACEQEVRARLVSPSTAEFAGGADPGHLVLPVDDDPETYVISSWVDSQNRMGAMLRSEWSCEVTCADRSCLVDDLELSTR